MGQVIAFPLSAPATPDPEPDDPRLIAAMLAHPSNFRRVRTLHLAPCAAKAAE